MRIMILQLFLQWLKACPDAALQLVSWWKTFLLKFSVLAGPTWQYVGACPDWLQILCATSQNPVVKLLFTDFYERGLY